MFLIRFVVFLLVVHILVTHLVVIEFYTKFLLSFSRTIHSVSCSAISCAPTFFRYIALFTFCILTIMSNLELNRNGRYFIVFTKYDLILYGHRTNTNIIWKLEKRMTNLRNKYNLLKHRLPSV